uniref:14-3-3 domain-containing protein n=1 Tax=Ditylenchus dipsaci TaxID=166011 RepID=A0A915DCY0_9BILA
MHTEMHEKSADAAAWYHITAFAFALLYFVLPQLKQYFDNINEQVSKNSQDLLAEERNLFSYAFKNSVTVRRDNWRVLTAHELKLDEADPVKEVAMRCREQIEIELRGCAIKVWKQSTRVLLPNQLMLFQRAVEKSRAAYTEGLETAKKEMSPAHPIRLDLVLNFAVFYYEIGNSPYKACQLVKQSLEDALPDVEKIEDGMKQDSRMILQLLRDNLSLWTVLDFEKKKGNKKLWFTW